MLPCALVGNEWLELTTLAVGRGYRGLLHLLALAVGGRDGRLIDMLLHQRLALTVRRGYGWLLLHMLITLVIGRGNRWLLHLLIALSVMRGNGRLLCVLLRLLALAVGT